MPRSHHDHQQFTLRSSVAAAPSGTRQHQQQQARAGHFQPRGAALQPAEEQMSLLNCLDAGQETDTNTNVINDPLVQKHLDSALQAAAGTLGFAAPKAPATTITTMKNRPRAYSDPISQSASQIFPDQHYQNSIYSKHHNNNNKYAQASKATTISGDSDWEDYLENDDENDLMAVYGIGNENVNKKKSAARTGNSGQALSRFPRSSNPYRSIVTAGKTARFHQDLDDGAISDDMNIDFEQEKDVKPFMMPSRKETILSSGTDQSGDYAEFGLTELGKMERQVAAPQCVRTLLLFLNISC